MLCCDCSKILKSTLKLQKKTETQTVLDLNYRNVFIIIFYQIYSLPLLSQLALVTQQDEHQLNILVIFHLYFPFFLLFFAIRLLRFSDPRSHTLERIIDYRKHHHGKWSTVLDKGYSNTFADGPKAGLPSLSHKAMVFKLILLSKYLAHGRHTSDSSSNSEHEHFFLSKCVG